MPRDKRRYVESLSSYARQFLGRMSKPECDFIKGIPPAIAIEQKVNSRNPRSTVGTSTEIYEYLRLLYARVGKTYSPVSGEEVKKHSIEDIVNCMLSYPEGTRYTVLTQIYLHDGRTLEQQLEIDRKQGFNRLEVNGEMVRIDEYAAGKEDVVYLLVDRMTAAKSKDAISRLTDSAETAMYEGDGMCMLRFYQPDGTTRLHTFSTKFEADGMTFEEPNDQMFSFNSPIGACPVCEGFGKVIGIDEHLVVPNRSLSVYDGAIVCWRGEKMGEWREELIHNAEKFNFPIFTPYYELTDEQRRVLWEGNQYFHGINDFFKMLEENQYKIQYRVMLARYRGKTLCPKCHGTRLKPEAGYVRVGGKNISELVDLPITELQKFFDSLTLNEHDQAVARRILTEINSRIRFLIDVGPGLSHTEPPQQFVVGRRKPAHQPGHFVGKQLGGQPLHPRRTEYRTPQSGYRPIGSCAPPTPAVGQHGRGGRARRRNHPCRRLHHRHRSECRTTGRTGSIRG